MDGKVNFYWDGHSRTESQIVISFAFTVIDSINFNTVRMYFMQMHRLKVMREVVFLYCNQPTSAVNIWALRWWRRA